MRNKKFVKTVLEPRVHADFIRAARLNGETMSSALARFAKSYVEEVKDGLFEDAAETRDNRGHGK